MPDDYIEHPNLKDETLESRTYQELIAASAADENTLCVLPTGLGKTAVAIILAAKRLEDHPGSNILVLAPTRPLTEQHRDSFQRALDNGTDIFEVLTGDTRPEKREEVWNEIGAFFATPQVVENDIIADRLDLSRFSLVVFDECHRATGDYPYSFIADKYHKKADDPRILGLTASPGGDRDKIEQVAENLKLGNIEVRTEDDPDVKPYVQRKEVNWKKVSLDRHFERVKNHLEQAKRKRVKQLEDKGFLNGSSNRKDLLKARSKIRKQLSSSDDPELYQAISRIAAAMKVDHALELLETQGVENLYDFLENMKNDPGSKAAKRLLDDEDFKNAIAVTEWMHKNDKRHPKMQELEDLLSKKMTGDDTAIVFTQYRDSVDIIHDALEDQPHIEPEKFKGQQDGGMTQQQQIEILDRFRDDDFNVLVSTSVGEEGLDIPAVDYVVFYEPVPSEVRTIQRRGRTGRQEEGHIYVLMAEDTRDEAYYWSAKNKEDRMQDVLEDLKDDSMDVQGGQKTLESYSEEDEDGVTLVVYADDRENTLAKKLSQREATVRTKRLEVADFLVSDRTAVERKSAADFVDSIIDQRLFPQLKEMTGQFDQPVLLIEGEDLYGHRDVHPNAIRGALSSIALDYQVPILWTGDEKETADTLVALAKREQEEQDREVTIRGERSPRSETELQKYIVAGLPNVSDKLAGRLLQHFGSVRDVFAASETELQKVDGIGEGKAERIKEILDKQYG
ncbi:MAG: DEAD/DEAH box helicase [Candidatus Nanohaloarchaea archaeon]|nr:DEAD/DEAH box helicase [Candidatus Nanohaloarchaea archaeon]